MIDVTEDQIKEVLERLRDYSIHCYFTERGVKMLEAHVIELHGRKVSLSIRTDGKIAATDQDTKVQAVYDAIITTATLQSPTTLDHLQYRAMICDKVDLSSEDQAFFNDVIPFVLSYFQRLNAFTFFARMQPVTIENMAKDLALAQ